jgi:hypothetical protein
MEDHLYPVVSTNKTVTKSLRYRWRIVETGV